MGSSTTGTAGTGACIDTLGTKTGLIELEFMVLVAAILLDNRKVSTCCNCAADNESNVDSIFS